MRGDELEKLLPGRRTDICLCADQSNPERHITFFLPKQSLTPDGLTEYIGWRWGRRRKRQRQTYCDPRWLIAVIEAEALLKHRVRCVAKLRCTKIRSKQIAEIEGRGCVHAATSVK